MKKRHFLILICCCLVFLLCCCGKKENKPSNNNTPNKDTVTDDTTPEEDKAPEDLLTPDISLGALNEESKADEAIDMSSTDWDIVAFRFLSATYSLPFSYARISEHWTFHLSDYGYDETFLLQPGERTTATVELTNPVVDYPMIVGFYNPYDVPISIEESQVWSVTIDMADSSSEILPMLPGNLSRGIDIVDIIILYDTPVTPFSYNEETGTYDMYYQFGANRFEYGHQKYVTLYIDAVKGLQKFTIQSYEVPVFY